MQAIKTYNIKGALSPLRPLLRKWPLSYSFFKHPDHLNFLSLSTQSVWPPQSTPHHQRSPTRVRGL